VQRDDAQSRLLVDRTLGRLMQSRQMIDIYKSYFGAPDQALSTCSDSLRCRLILQSARRGAKGAD
jgi:hypothetical protein